MVFKRRALDLPRSRSPQVLATERAATSSVARSSPMSRELSIPITGMRLLRARGERPRHHCAAAPFHAAIAMSFRSTQCGSNRSTSGMAICRPEARNASGISSPSALAVFRLIEFEARRLLEREGLRASTTLQDRIEGSAPAQVDHLCRHWGRTSPEVHRPPPPATPTSDERQTLPVGGL